MKRKLSTKISILVILTLLLSNLNTSSIHAEYIIDTSDNSATTLEEYKSNEIIITYKDPVVDDNYKTEPLLTTIQEEDINKLSDYSVLLEVEDEKELTKTIALLKQNESISSIQPNYTYKATGMVNDPYYPLQWYLENTGSFVDEYKTASTINMDMNVGEAWENYTANRDIIIAVIDTGIAHTHEDLKDVMWTNSGETPDDKIDNDSNGYTDDVYGWNYYSNSNSTYNRRTLDDHGTHVAGIIAATQNNVGISGVASKSRVKIMSIQALGGSERNGSTDSIINAIHYADQMGATICNISAGTTSYDEALETAIKESNMLFVVAAGNGDEDGNGLNNDVTPLYPAAFDLDNIISVANIRCNGTLHSSSNYGVKSVDIAAPGTSIWSTLAGNRYGYFTGTSMAAPMVTGVVAMIYTYYKDITLPQTKAILLDSVKRLPTLSDKVTSGGIPDVVAALSYTPEELLAFDLEPPAILTSEQKLTNSYYKQLNISIKDNIDTLTHIRYAKGKQSVDYFANGSEGSKLTLKNSKASIKVKDTSFYTIYAMDQVGNQTIKIIKVTITKPKTISVPSSKTLLKGKTYTLKPTLTPNKVSAGLTFTSSNTKVATVLKTTGKITAKSKGTTTITVKTQNGLIAKCKLTVN